MAEYLCDPIAVQGPLRVNRFNPYEGYLVSESVGQDILLAGRAAMNRALDGDIVAVELLPEDQWVCLLLCYALPLCDISQEALITPSTLLLASYKRHSLLCLLMCDARACMAR